MTSEADLAIIAEQEKVRDEIRREEAKMRAAYRRGDIDDLLKPENKTPRLRELEKKFDELIAKQREVLVTNEFDRIYTIGYCQYPYGNNPPCAQSTGTLPNMMAARSRHPGGVNATMCDGSVRFVKNSINFNIWRAISTTRGGEVVSAEALKSPERLSRPSG